LKITSHQLFRSRSNNMVKWHQRGTKEIFLLQAIEHCIFCVSKKILHLNNINFLNNRNINAIKWNENIFMVKNVSSDLASNLKNSFTAVCNSTIFLYTFFSITKILYKKLLHVVMYFDNIHYLWGKKKPHFLYRYCSVWFNDCRRFKTRVNSKQRKNCELWSWNKSQ